VSVPVAGCIRGAEPSGSAAVTFLGQLEAFWVVMPCNVVVGYQRLGGPCCLHLQGENSSQGFTDCDAV
jgi:hypothetical protein